MPRRRAALSLLILIKNIIPPPHANINQHTCRPILYEGEICSPCKTIELQAAGRLPRGRSRGGGGAKICTRPRQRRQNAPRGQDLSAFFRQKQTASDYFRPHYNTDSPLCQQKAVFFSKNMECSASARPLPANRGRRSPFGRKEAARWSPLVRRAARRPLLRRESRPRHSPFRRKEAARRSPSGLCRRCRAMPCAPHMASDKQ